MFNPNSAIDRIKNSLSYKLGLAIIEHKKQYKEWGYIVLLYKLYKIKQQYKKEQKLYKQTIKIFPHLAYSKVEFCKDYNESIKYKYHLSYMLGETLICAHKTWYKGGYFKLPSLLKEKYKLYKNIQDIISILPQNLHYHFYNSTIKNHKINIQSLVYILKQHKDYNPILENIFHNFDFFIKHFDLINTWLLSNDFKEKYKQENHPYPSLLDPKKLNDDNEKINYKNIPAELAWEMNLPLPDRYKFVLFTFGLTGHSVLLRALVYHGVKLQWYSNDYKKLYLDHFKYSYDCIHVLFLNTNDFRKSLKYINLFPKIVTIFLIRDPISKFKTGLNHGGYKKGCGNYDIINHNIPIEQIIDRVKYPFLEQITIGHMLNFWLNNGIWYYDTILKNIYTDKIYFLDMEDLMPDKIISTFANLKLEFKLNSVDNLEQIQKMVFGPYRYILPIIIKFSFKEYMNINVYIELKDRMTNGNIILNNMFRYSHVLLQDISFSVLKSDFKKLNDKLIEKIDSFQKIFLDVLYNKIRYIQNKKWSEENILSELLNNKSMRKKIFNMLNQELNFIKKYHPDIIASWKYYQEFEKMCKELDGD